MKIKTFFLLALYLSSAFLMGQTPPDGADTPPGVNVPVQSGGSLGNTGVDPTNRSDLGSALFDEEAELNLTQAKERYQAIIDRFDRQRDEAAQAVFRLGEVYRKLGRIEEAKVQYARILREFPDQTKLAELSLQRMFKETEHRFGGDIQGATSSTALPTDTAAGLQGLRKEDPFRLIEESQNTIELQQNLLREEIALVENLVQMTRKRYEMGQASQEEVIQVQRDLLQLKRQLAQTQQPELFDINSQETESSSAGSNSKRKTAQTNACLNNLRQIDGAKEQWALENKKANGSPINESEINQYIRGGRPECPAGGTYEYHAVGEPPTCSVPGHSIPKPQN